MSSKFLYMNRRSLLKSGGALIVGFSFAESLNAQETTPAPAGPPAANEIDSWIAIHADNSATVHIGFVELGQGCSTALLQVAADELDLSMNQVSMADQSTADMHNQGGTYSSSAIRNGRPQVQRASAEARQAILDIAADYLQIPASSLLVDNGIITSGGDDNVFITYGELIGDQQFSIPFTGTAPLKNPDNYRYSGKPQQRKDMPLKVSGSYNYLQHLKLPGMLHGRIVRPPGQGAYQDGVQIQSVNQQSIAGIPAQVLRKGNFLAVVAEREWDAVRAARTLEVNWSRPTRLSGTEAMPQVMENTDTNDIITLSEGDTSILDQAFISSSIEGFGPYQSHAPFAPNAALADVKADSARVMCASPGHLQHENQHSQFTWHEPRTGNR